MTDLVTQKPGGVQVVTEEPNIEPNIMSLLVDLAKDKDVDADKLGKLVEMQERQEQNQARKAFNMALADFHENAPAIVKDKQGNNCKYADFGAVVKAVRPALLSVGISVAWSSEPFQNGETKVTCILRHKLGHEERSSLSGRPEDSGSKNSIQGVGSTDSYLRRYTLLSVAGLVAEGEDTDGNAVFESSIDDEQIAHVQELLNSSQSDVEQFCRHFRVTALKNLSNKQYGAAVSLLNAKVKRIQK